MYKVLYRKYRPQYFSDVVGQPQITTTLQNEIKNSRVSHAYLFTGTRGTGKTTCAKIFAKAVNCLTPENGDACGKCSICQSADDGTLLDIMEIDAASNNGVENIRTLIEEANFTPAVAKYRVYIIDEVHMLSAAAFNALLKTLEEPPEHVIFILATTEVHRLLPTILSRCQRFDFRRISPKDVADRLIYIANEENAVLELDAALLIAQITDGTMRDAISILDQCLSRCEHVTEDVVAQTAGIANRDYLILLTRTIIDREAPVAIELLDNLYRESKDMARLCEEMGEYFRGLMLIKTMKHPESILNISSKELDEMEILAKSFELSAILYVLSVFEETQGRMQYGNTRTEMEMAFLKLCHPRLNSSMDSVLHRIDTLERNKSQGFYIQQTENIKSVQSSEQQKGLPENGSAEAEAKIGMPPASGEINADTLHNKIPLSASGLSIEELSRNAEKFSGWPEVLEEIIDQLKGQSRSIAAAFQGSSAYVSGDYMLIKAPELVFNLLKKRTQRELIREIIRKATGKPYKLGPYKEPKNENKGETADSLDILEIEARKAGIEIK